ncbi:FliH/SctL family protein [Paenibacillus sp. N1-5-1-14]|uniref:FliH/SctL family protein n=1 Tax=Paenibacillus radicibacter TaxID=2972488 RepID=UPI002159A1E7|nr:FliH/SctL family protein [Paenibacillus radicibacter]
MSNVIKPISYRSLDDKKIIEAVSLDYLRSSIDLADDEEEKEWSARQRKKLEEAEQLKSQIIGDAEAFAEAQIAQAVEEANLVKDQVREDIDTWWAERRADDEELVNTAKADGYEQGYAEGITKAEDEILSRYETMLMEARAILDDAHKIKEQIIGESEPFLIELSSSIAEKVISRQLSIEPEWTLEMIRNVLARRQEKGVITLCVSPKHFAYINNAREELLMSIDSQAELQILPDSTVNDEGCVIRSSYGSVDARIDTQMKEIKSVLLQMAVRDEGDLS